MRSGKHHWSKRSRNKVTTKTNFPRPRPRRVVPWIQIQSLKFAYWNIDGFDIQSAWAIERAIEKEVGISFHYLYM